MTAVPDDARSVVSKFYSLLSHGEADAIAELVADHFGEEARLSRPESLPGGGTISGAPIIAKFMRKAAGAAKGLQLKQLHIASDTGTVHAFAVVELTIGTPTTAIEWWVFEAGVVTSLSAYYWDTAAIIAR